MRKLETYYFMIFCVGIYQCCNESPTGRVTSRVTSRVISVSDLIIQHFTNIKNENSRSELV